MSDETHNPALATSSGDSYVLRLHIAGVTPRSLQAIETIKRVCEHHLRGRYVLEVIDIHQQPIVAKADQIIAAPTLIRRLPEPLRRLIGDMSDEQRVLVGLGLRPRDAADIHGKAAPQ